MFGVVGLQRPAPSSALEKLGLAKGSSFCSQTGPFSPHRCTCCPDDLREPGKREQMVQYDHPWLSNNPVVGFGASLPFPGFALTSALHGGCVPAWQVAHTPCQRPRHQSLPVSSGAASSCCQSPDSESTRPRRAKHPKTTAGSCVHRAPCSLSTL